MDTAESIRDEYWDDTRRMKVRLHWLHPRFPDDVRAFLARWARGDELRVGAFPLFDFKPRVSRDKLPEFVAECRSAHARWPYLPPVFWLGELYPNVLVPSLLLESGGAQWHEQEFPASQMIFVDPALGGIDPDAPNGDMAEVERQRREAGRKLFKHAFAAIPVRPWTSKNDVIEALEEAKHHFRGAQRMLELDGTERMIRTKGGARERTTVRLPRTLKAAYQHYLPL